MKAIDFFCGVGGLSRGLLNAGVEVVAGFDNDERCKSTYEKNNPGASFFKKDIRKINLNDVNKIVNLSSYDDVLFAGCAPCQPFSSQNKGTKRKIDATLLNEFGRLVAAAKPGYVLIENVPGIARVKGYSTFRRFLKLLVDNKYQYTFGTLNAKNFGVAQNRRRLVLLASRISEVTLPDVVYSDTLLPFRTVRNSISHFPSLNSGESHADVLNHVAASISELNLKRLKRTPHNGGDRRSWPKKLQLKCHKGKYKGHTDVYGRMSWDNPAPTLTTKCISISNGRYGHPEQNRAITLREAAALQSFPDEYEFFGARTHIAVQIGNAVPVKLAEYLGKHILQLNMSAK